MLHETYRLDAKTSFGIDIAAAPSDGKKYPIVVLVHGNFGLGKPFGEALQKFTEEIAALGYLAALPSYYPPGESHPNDVDIDTHVPALVAAVKHLYSRSDADPTRLGLVGFSLGGGIAMSYINSSPADSVKAFADFYGYVGPKLGEGVAKFPPTIIFNNQHDPYVPVAQNSEPLADALERAAIAHEPGKPYSWYNDNWDVGKNHVLKPGGRADVDSRDKTKEWLKKYMPPVGRS
jgi:carboxymethylenebutenolidase